LPKQTRIVVIGGTACGPKAAARARRRDPQAKITIVEQGQYISSATCGLPYYVSGVISEEEKLVARKPDFFKKVMDIDVLTRTKAIAIERQAHQVEVLNQMTNKTQTIPYDKLVLATGSRPVLPKLKGIKLGGVFTLTRVEDALALRKLITKRQIKQVVVIGAGLIGLEAAEAFTSLGIRVTVVEALGWVLPELLDFEVACYVQKHLEAQGVKLISGQRAIGFEGDDNGWMRQVITSDQQLPADLVIIAIGAKPNIKLAKEAGLTIGTTGAIAVNTYLQTSDPDIFAGGDCAQNKSLITGRAVLSPMGSTANKHGRVIGTNVTGGSESFPGVLGTTVCKVFEYNVARVGLTQLQAEKAGYEVLTSLVPASEYASYYPNGKEILIKLITEKASGRILGGQAVGPGETAKRIDVLATALTFKATVDELASLDLAYAPPYNSAMDPLHNAANVIRNKKEGLARALSPVEVKNKINGKDDFILLDVRSTEEWEDSRLEAPQTRLLPLTDLRSRRDGLHQNSEIVIFCRTSVRAYQAQRILDGCGFKDVKFMDGSIEAWPYEVVNSDKGTDAE